ncbi:MAG: cupin domain-containing protein [Candidatus Aenigmarchaeota archaeon]|nr:cupin domain-containing protein [Candidatus Aenigmarchaeota archaeon]
MKYIDRKKVKWVEKKGYTAQIFFDFKEKGNNSRFVLIKLKPRNEIKPHYHTKIKEILYVTKGSGKISINGAEKSFKKEDIFLIEPNDVHSMKNESGEDMEWLEFKMHDPPEKDIFFV